MEADAGKVAGLFLGSEPGGPILRTDSVEAVAGQGLVGDRYFSSDGGHHPTQEITLFAQEDVGAARAESGLDIDELDLRRNVMTVGVDLAGLVGGALRIGDVVIDQLTPNPPCAHLQRLADKPLLQPLVDRGGLRGRIAQGGTVREGDRVEPLPRDGS